MTNDKLDEALKIRKQITLISESINDLRNISNSVAQCTDQEKIYCIKVEQPKIGYVASLHIGICPNYVEVLIAIQEVLHKQLQKLELDFDSL